MAKQISDNKILLEKVRLAFPNLLEPSSYNGSAPKYGATFLFDVGSDNAKLLEQLVLRVAKGKFGARADKVIAGMKRTDKFPVKDGNNKAEYMGFADHLFCNANNSVQPTLVMPDRRPMGDKEVTEYLYSGAYVNVVLGAYGYSKNGSEGVGLGLEGVQFVKHGDRFGGGAKAKDDDFPELELAEDDNVGMFG